MAEWIVVIIVLIIIVIIVISVQVSKVPEKKSEDPKRTFDYYENAGIFIPGDKRNVVSDADLDYDEFGKTMPSIADAVDTILNEKTIQPEPVKKYNNYFDQYYDLYKDLDYEELKEALNVDNKENYADYTDEEKQRWRAVKVLMEEIENNNFRNYFINKEFLKEIDSGALKYKIQQIDFRENFNKMEAIPEIIKREADKHAEFLAENELIDKLKTKTFKQLYNYYDKRGVSSFSEKLQNYYHFRDKYLVKENILKRDIEKIKNISMRADDEETMRATRADMHKMEDDLKWIMEGSKRVIDNEYHLTKPAVVENAINKYKESNDWFSQFLDECCEVDNSFSENSGEVYSAYRDYCSRVGDYIRSTTDFYTALESAGFQRRKTKTARLIYGLKLKSEFLEN